MEKTGSGDGRRAGDGGAVVTPYPDGPLILRGEFVIMSPDGQAFPDERRTVALCRCGRSGIKPFCDGSHARIGFRARDRTPGDRTPGDRAAGDRAPGDRAPGDRAPGDRAPGGRAAAEDGNRGGGAL
jgi:CDGSH-type Zn-finger protein